jgi:hypothetical protein
VPELWFWRNNRLEVHVFDESKDEYVASDQSRVLPGRMEYASDAIPEFRKKIGWGGG